MSHPKNISAREAMEKLVKGNEQYLTSDFHSGDVSRAIRLNTFNHGQVPYAIIITCSDSRVVPEYIFSAGIGDLFVIRVAGNVIDKHQLGSIEYGAEHLGTPLVVVLGHTRCGAVGAAINDNPSGYVKSITDEIKQAIGMEKDDYRAGCLNVANSVDVIKKSLGEEYIKKTGIQVIGAICNIDSGKVNFL